MSAGWVLFDWGDTLMRVFPEYDGPMVTWPRLEAMPGALETLAALPADWSLALATNAQESQEAQIWAALERVGLAVYLQRVFCYRRLGARKPDPAYFQAVLAELQVPGNQIWMVGDDFNVDVLGAVRSGLHGVWLNLRSIETRQGPGYTTIHAFEQLPQALTTRRWNCRET